MTTLRFGSREMDALWTMVLEGFNGFEDSDIDPAELRIMRRVLAKIATAK